MTGTFEIDGQEFVALNGGPTFTFNEAVSFQVHCHTQEEVDHYWNALSTGADAQVQQCGWLKDRGKSCQPCSSGCSKMDILEKPIEFDGRSGRNLGPLPGARTLLDLFHLAAVDLANGRRLHSERKSELVRHRE